MAIIKLSKLQFIPIITSVYKDYDLSAQQALIYGYLFNHCMNINKDGYCGYSDQRMADDLNISYERFRKELAVLRNKKLIYVRNPQKRSKQAGESRMLYINSDVYLEEQQLSLADLEVEALKKEVARLKKQLEEAAAEKSRANVIHGNYYTMYLYREFSKRDQISEENRDEFYATLSAVYEGLAVDYGHSEVIRHINYVLEQSKGTQITNLIGYLTTSIKDFTYKKTNGFL